MTRKDWVKIPTSWIIGKGLTNFRWQGERKSDYIAALIVYMVLVQYSQINEDYSLGVGHTKITFDTFQEITQLSRSKISNGIKILIDMQLIGRSGAKNKTYRILDFIENRGWAKFPSKHLFDDSFKTISIFKDFYLRKKNELNTLKLYLLFVAFRDRKLNHAIISYDKIQEYSGIPRSEIRPAISLLTNLNLIHVDKIKKYDGNRTNHYYRIVGIDNYRHFSTMPAEEFESLSADDYGKPPLEIFPK